MDISWLPGPVEITCPECDYKGLWFMATESVMCDNCAHGFPIMDGVKR